MQTAETDDRDEFGQSINQPMKKPVGDSGVAIDNGHDLSLEGSVISSDEWWLPRQPAGNRLGVTTSSACTEIIHKTPPFVDTSPSKTKAVKSGFGEAFC